MACQDEEFLHEGESSRQVFDRTLLERKPKTSQVVSSPAPGGEGRADGVFGRGNRIGLFAERSFRSAR